MEGGKKPTKESNSHLLSINKGFPFLSPQLLHLRDDCVCHRLSKNGLALCKTNKNKQKDNKAPHILSPELLDFTKFLPEGIPYPVEMISLISTPLSTSKLFISRNAFSMHWKYLFINFLVCCLQNESSHEVHGSVHPRT